MVVTNTFNFVANSNNQEIGSEKDTDDKKIDSAGQYTETSNDRGSVQRIKITCEIELGLSKKK